MNRNFAIRFFSVSLGLVSACAYGQSWEKQIAPGVVYRMEVDQSVPRVVHALRYSLGAPGLNLKSELGGGTIIEENASRGRETVSEMAARTGAIAAINGDYFPFTGDPLGVMVRDGKLLSTPGIPRAVFGWGSKSVAMGLVQFKGTAEFGGQRIAIKGVNEECPLNEVVLQTDAAAFATGKTPNVHAVVKMEASDWTPNGVFVGTFESLYADIPKLPIQPGNAVLTASGSKAELLKTMVPGEKVTFSFSTNGFDWSKIEQTIGGGPFLVRDGRVSVDAKAQGFNDAFTNKRHPRTAIGRSVDGDIWIAVVDGRQKISDGATLSEMARIMLDLGCTEAANLDGGGSSAINVFGQTLNRPSDGKERPVANGLIILGPKPMPTDSTFKLRLPEKVELGKPQFVSVVDGAGRQVPNVEVFWNSSGDAWVDQGGLVRPLQKGSAVISAFVKGHLVQGIVEVVEAAKSESPTKSRLSRSKKQPSRSKGGRGGT
jgi:hypothetical protein